MRIKSILTPAVVILCSLTVRAEKPTIYFNGDILTMDGDTPRQTRLTQENQLRFMAFVLFLIMVAMSVSCLFWTVFQMREQLRPKSAVEQELQLLRERAEQVVRTR